MMFTSIIEFILQNSTELLLVLLLASIVLFIGIVEKKSRLAPFSLALNILALAGTATAYLFRDLQLFGFSFVLPVVGFAALSSIINLLLYIYYNRRFYRILSLIKTSNNISGHKIYAYLDQRAKLINFTDDFADLLGIEKNHYKNFEELISSILVDSQEMNIRVFLHYLKSLEERDYHVAVTLYTGTTVKMNLLKRKVIANGRLLGFILMHQGGFSASEAAAGPDYEYFLNLLDDAVCYFDNRSKKYILTPQMATLLGISDAQINENSFLAAVVREDLDVLSNRSVSETNQKLFYRLNTTRGPMWFEENNIHYSGQVYVLIRRTDFFRLRRNYRNRQQLLETAKVIYERNNWLSLFVLEMSNLARIREAIGKEAAEVVLSNYFAKIIGELKLENLKIYQLEDLTFAFIIDNRNQYQEFLNCLENNPEKLTRVKINFNHLSFDLNNNIGVIASETAEDSRPETILNCALEALANSKDIKYPKSYCLYAPKQDDNTFDFKDYGIDLSDSFLDDILKK
jgi:hypothetical protein